MDNMASAARSYRQELNEHYQGKLQAQEERSKQEAARQESQPAEALGLGRPRRLRNRFKLKSGKEADQFKERMDQMTRREMKEQRNKMAHL